MSRFSLDNSIAACRCLTRKAHSSFVPAFSLLPKEKREAMEILYAFTRYTDDIVDNPADAKTKRQQFRQWCDILNAVFLTAEFPDCYVLSEKYPGCEGIVLLPALKNITEKFNIPVDAYFQLTAGVESDIEPQVFETFDNCKEYCHRVATSVGIASLAIWGTNEPLTSPQLVEAAENCGLAFQWTNILRDIVEDYQNGRIYLPVDEMYACGFLTDEKRVDEMLTLQLERCESFYRKAVPLYEMINPDSRNVFAMMFLRYYKLFRKIK
ncbi:MAG: squalene/phytoene synthase family protein, partial [Planctomycetaceae bacterium]|nr:squalene/phytoene synthase family protein [Planctomycetaceae bacterium]